VLASGTSTQFGGKGYIFSILILLFSIIGCGSNLGFAPNFFLQ
jgi:hypothetical protein